MNPQERPDPLPGITFRGNIVAIVDDLLLTEHALEDCTGASKALLEELGLLGYKVSATKAQVCLNTFKYIGY